MCKKEKEKKIAINFKVALAVYPDIFLYIRKKGRKKRQKEKERERENSIVIDRSV